MEFDEPVVAGVATAGSMNAAIDSEIRGWIRDYMSDCYGAVVAPGDWTEPTTPMCLLTGKFTAALLSNTLVSLRFSMDSYSIDANYDIKDVVGITLRVADGTAIALRDLISDEAATLAIINAEAKAHAAPLLEARGMPWYPATTLERAADGWTMTAAGLELSWSVGGTKTAKAVTITIPWASLASVIDPSGPAAGL